MTPSFRTEQVHVRVPATSANLGPGFDALGLALDLVDDLRAGRDVEPTRGARLCTFKETARILAGFPDERPGAVEESVSAGPASLVGLRLAKGEAAPARVVHPRNGGPHDESQDREVHEPSPTEHLSSHDAPQDTSASDPAHPAGPVAEEGE